MSGEIVDNINAPKVTFIKKNGRVMLRGNGKSLAGERILNERINIMVAEVNAAEAGRVVTTMKDMGVDGIQFRKSGVKSTFPDFFRDAGFSTKKGFIRAAKRRKGPAFKRIVNQAITDLLEGYESSFGFVPPDQEFLIKTKQKFDNRNVIFRNINGRIVPIKTNKKINTSSEVPF